MKKTPYYASAPAGPGSGVRCPAADAGPGAAGAEDDRRFLFNDPNSPRIGAKNPKLTLVVFTDYNCPYCKKFDPYLEKIVEKHPDVAVVFKFLPFRSESSLTAARDALTLWRQEPGSL